MRRFLRIVAAGFVVGLLLLPVAAAAQTYPNPPSTPSVSTDPGSRGGTQTRSSEPSGGLPFTGAQITVLVILGVAAIGTGVVLVRVARRRHHDAVPQ